MSTVDAWTHGMKARMKDLEAEIEKLSGKPGAAEKLEADYHDLMAEVQSQYADLKERVEAWAEEEWEDEDWEEEASDFEQTFYELRQAVRQAREKVA